MATPHRLKITPTPARISTGGPLGTGTPGPRQPIPVRTVTTSVDGADGGYTVRGTSCRLHDPSDAQTMHNALVAVLDRPDG